MFTPSSNSRRFWPFAIAGVWIAVTGFAAATGRVAPGDAAVRIGVVVLLLAAWLGYERWWNRPLPATPGERPAERSRTGESLAFPLALTVTLVGTMALLGFPGGGFGIGLVALATIALGGWWMLRRAIDGGSGQ